MRVGTDRHSVNCLSIPTALGIPHITVNHPRILSAAHKACRSTSAGLDSIPPIGCVWVESIRGKWAEFLETGSSSTDGSYHLASHKLATDVEHEYFLKGFPGPDSIIPNSWWSSGIPICRFLSHLDQTFRWGQLSVVRPHPMFVEKRPSH